MTGCERAVSSGQSDGNGYGMDGNLVGGANEMKTVGRDGEWSDGPRAREPTVRSSRDRRDGWEPPSQHGRERRTVESALDDADRDYRGQSVGETSKELFPIGVGVGGIRRTEMHGVTIIGRMGGEHANLRTSRTSAMPGWGRR
ncbi:hypothetical protein GUJ93_ZPchr0013g35473 [Zizania palustris]|uniref:Uncharacterized protein n=1 Tax=Zizania palustris TaxID=103762 RepID=A0A8J6C3F3_ZIZPA|nr:hypothetical protein GUJ93_ZPchr0013g35473 [Zizania palustris]